LYADPDPDPTAQINADPCGSGSGYGSGSETLNFQPNVKAKLYRSFFSPKNVTCYRKY
jgi:hypothetical protein